ncbi:MAG TPA: alanine:cation symporter family protein [Saprospiraceae bacterium]|nr:alanine:cation symporter family protein [Saprospiraceae bacterium]
MKQLLLIFTLLIFGVSHQSYAQEKSEGLDARINQAVKPATTFISDIIFYPVTVGGHKTITDVSLDTNSHLLSVKLDNGATRILDLSKREGEGKSNPNIRLDHSTNILTLGDGTEMALNDSLDSKVPIVLFVLILGALFFTIRFGFVNIRKLGLSIDIVRGKYDDIDEHVNDPVTGDEVWHTLEGDIPDTERVEGHHGEVSHFQALTAALSATVGLGNIAGVAIAIAIGGPGATLWMILAGFIGMSTKFVECTLGVKYREIEGDGTVHGGPMYYLKKGLAEKGFGGLGKVFAIFYAVMVVGGSFGGGNMFQANQATAQFISLTGIKTGYVGAAFGLFMAILVGIVIIGGIKRIGSVAEKIVPLMAILYVGAGLIILAMNYDLIPSSFGQIWDGAFSGRGIVGGFAGVLIQGFKRAAFSNEAGVGSAAIAHAAVKTKYPVSEGLVAMIGPFVDTVIICTITALVIVIYNNGGHFDYGNVVDGEVLIQGSRVGGVDLTSAAFDSAIPGFSYILTVAVILFAFSTMLSWSYYGLQGWKVLFGRSKAADTTYKVLFLLFVIIGSSASLGAVTDFSDAMIFAMIFPNMIGLVVLAPVVQKEFHRFLEVIKGKK